MSQNHEVDLFSFYDDPHDKKEIPHLKRYCRRLYAEPISQVTSRFRAVSALARSRPFSTAFFYSPTMARRVSQAMRSRSYDVAFVFGSAMAQYVEPWKELPKILDLVDVDSDKWTQYSNRTRGPLSWLWRREGQRLERCESDSVRNFNNTLVCTEAESHLLRSKATSGKINVLDNQLDLDYYRPGKVRVSDEIKSWQPYVIFTGTMDYFPNIDAVLYFYRQILPKVHAHVPGLNFVIAGRKPSRQIMRLADDQRVRVTGAVADIRPYLQGAAVAVAPMRVARGVQNKILEALAMDRPVVTSACAAAALPADLALLVAAEADASLLAARVTDCVLLPLKRACSVREGLERYVKANDMALKLERYLAEAVSDVKTKRSRQQIEIAV